MSELLSQTASALEARGFETHVFATARQAADFVLSDIADGASVGIGGSSTVKELNLDTRLRENGHTVFWHWGIDAGQAECMRRNAMNAPFYLCSANALTTSGLMVNIDGTGNRVAAMCYGPQTVYMLIGRNKIVKGGYTQAVKRIKQVACPLNARRLGLDTPCAKDGQCNASECRHSMCRMILSCEQAATGKRTVVLLIDEDVGF